MSHDTRRLFLAALCLSLWLGLLLNGVIVAGFVHLLLIAALVLFPWRR